jgi:hypothetical protein
MMPGMVLRWVLVLLLVLLVVNAFTTFFQKMGFGKLPGDFKFECFGRTFFLPLTTSALLMLAVTALAKWL